MFVQLNNSTDICSTKFYTIMHEDLNEFLNRYQTFLEGKIKRSPEYGFDVDDKDLHPSLFPHQVASVKWMVKGGRRLLAKSFGLGKTRVQIETCRQIINKEGGKALFVCPLGVRQEFTQKDGPAMGVNIVYCRNMQEVAAAGTDYIITNYERVRDGQIIPANFTVISLDEGSVLRSYGTKTTQQFMDLCHDVKYRFIATATPAPNRYLELVNYAHFLGIMDRGQILTRFFQRDSKKAGNLTLYPHKEEEFWFWLCGWAMLIYKPSDLGFSDEGYDLPELKVFYHEIPADHSKAWDKTDQNGNRYLFQHEAMGLVAGAAEKRETIGPRLEKAKEVIAEFGADEHWLIWHHLENERRDIEKQIPGALSVFGSQDLEVREQRIMDFSDGKFKILATKPEISGSGCNFQRHCHLNVFLGVNYDFNDFIQSIHRTQRFLQKHTVEVHIIHTETERSIVKELRKKWAQHEYLQQKMRDVVSQFGLNQYAMTAKLTRSIGLNRQEASGKNWKYVNNDTVIETASMAENSVDLIVTSIPFSNHYEYTPSYNDFGHTENDDHFGAQMDFLIPNLLRVLKPGRVAAVHVKDRIFYGKVTGYGMSTVNPFHAKTLFQFMKHGFLYMGMVTVTTDVVSENNQTYRLTYGEMRKDSTKMGFGSPEYILLFRKMPSSTENAYADDPVTHDREDYSLARWQLNADANWRSSGNRQLNPEELTALVALADKEKGLQKVRAKFLEFFRENVYDFETHVAVGEALEEKKRLPKTFSLLTPQTKSEFVWDDIIRMRTLNLQQAQNVREKHVCPLQLDLVERLILQFTEPGEVVYDPFGGIATVPYCAVKLGRYGIGSELNGGYWRDGISYLKEAEYSRDIPTLFDVLDEVNAPEAKVPAQNIGMARGKESIEQYMNSHALSD